MFTNLAIVNGVPTLFDVYDVTINYHSPLIFMMVHNAESWVMVNNGYDM